MTSEIDNLLNSHFKISEETADHHFRTEIPNIVFKLDLDPYEFYAYSVIKKIAGNRGGCWKSNPNLAKDCNMSETKLKKCLKKLSSPFELLNGQALIKIIERTGEENKKQCLPNLLIIIDIWRINGDDGRKIKKENTGSPKNWGGSRQKTGGGSPKTYKEDPIYKSDCNDFDVLTDKLKIFDFHQNETTICKDDIHFLKAKNNVDWTEKEIEYLWERLLKHKGFISNLFAFSDAIIKKDRLMKKIEKQKIRKNTCYNKTQKYTHQKKSQTTTNKNEDLQEKSKLENINQSTSEEDMKMRPFANWKVMFGL